MFKTTILKLRQEESVPSLSNASYKTTLSRPVLINEGDQIQIKSVFLDTAAESTVIVEKDFTASIVTAKYLTNYYLGGDGALSNPFRSAGTDPVTTFTGQDSITNGPDNKKYWTYKTNPANGRNRLLKSLLIIPIREQKFGGISFQLQVRDPLSTDDPARFKTIPTIQIPKKLEWSKHKTGYVLAINAWVNIATGSENYDNIRIIPFTGSEKGNWEKNNMYFPDYTKAVFGTEAQTGFQLDPVTSTCNIPIAAGEYSPTQLAQKITDAMSVLVEPDGKVGVDYTQNPPQFLSASPFLSSTFQQYLQCVQDDFGKIPDPATGNDTMIIMREDGQTLYSYWGRPIARANDNFIGTNNASLNFDATLNKLNFDVLHFPVQVDSGGIYVPGIVYTPDTSLHDKAHAAVLSYGGVGIVDFTPPAFWANLGFTPDNTLNISQEEKGVFSYTSGFIAGTTTPLSTGRGCHVTLIESVDGKQTTSQFPGMDLIVNNTAATWMNPFLNTLGIASSITNPIVGDRIFNGATNDDGFYMVDIGVKMPQSMISSDKPGVSGSNFMQSIVGKFFTAGNFLQDSGDGSIVYTHVGAPQMVSELDVRILNGDGSVPVNTDIGGNNTIFLEVIQSVVPPAAIMPSQNK